MSDSRVPPKSFLDVPVAPLPKVMGTGVPKGVDEVADAIKQKFSGAIARVAKEHIGDPFVVIQPAQIASVIEFLRDNERFLCNNLLMIGATDFLPIDQPATETQAAKKVEGRIEVVYILSSYVHHHQITLKVELPRDGAKVISICPLYRCANWYERECYDMIGVGFEGHPDLKRILLPNDWVGHPLRRDYIFPEEYNGMKVPL